MANWEYFDAYRLNVDIVNTFLREIFGYIDFQTQVILCVFVPVLGRKSKILNGISTLTEWQ